MALPLPAIRRAMRTSLRFHFRRDSTDEYAKFSRQPQHKSLLLTMLHLVRHLELRARISACADQVASLQAKMKSKREFENFNGDLGNGLAGLIERSVS